MFSFNIRMVIRAYVEVKKLSDGEIKNFGLLFVLQMPIARGQHKAHQEDSFSEEGELHDLPLLGYQHMRRRARMRNIFLHPHLHQNHTSVTVSVCASLKDKTYCLQGDM